MQLLSQVTNILRDFLFPKSRRSLELESLAPHILIEMLPEAEPISKEIIAAFDYSNPLVKEIVWEIKYRGNKQIAGLLGRILYDSVRQELEELAIFDPKWKPGEILLIPIPVSDKRRAERGWNQVELLAQAIEYCDNARIFKYLPRQLVKYRHTESQTKTASREERLKNLLNSMKVLNPAKIDGKSIVLVDDVVTTGATVKEAIRALKEAGAKKIISIAIAH